jgi:GPH family glycoside/pentoside/hexuronide:cation symporter
MMIIYSVINIPYCALGGVITADSQERVSANSYRFFLATSAGVLIASLGPTLVKYFGKNNPQLGYSWTMVVFGVMAVLAFFACFALVRERITAVAPGKGAIMLDVKSLLRNDQWLIVAALFFFLLIGVVLRAGSAAYYINWFAKHKELTAAFLTTGTVSQMIGASLASTFTKRFDKMPTYIASQVFVVLGSIALYFTPGGNLKLIFCLFAFINFFVQIGAPILFSMAADTAEYGELKTGRRVTGLIFSGALFTLKLGVAVGGFAIGLVLDHYGYIGTAEVQTEKAIHGIVLAVTLFPAFFHFLLIPLVSRFNLTHKRCQEIRDQLDAKRAANLS